MDAKRKREVEFRVTSFAFYSKDSGQFGPGGGRGVSVTQYYSVLVSSLFGFALRAPGFRVSGFGLRRPMLCRVGRQSIGFARRFVVSERTNVNLDFKEQSKIAWLGD